MSRVTITVDKVAELLSSLDALGKQRVLVGIPGEAAGREDGITNAMLGYVHEFGSPEQNIAARPFLRSAAEQTRDQVISILRKGAEGVMNGNADAAAKALTAAGQLGASKAKEIMSAGEGFAPLTQGALRSRVARALRGKGLARRDDLKKWNKARVTLLKKGRFTLEGATPLIDTGQLRNAITFVIREK